MKDIKTRSLIRRQRETISKRDQWAASQRLTQSARRCPALLKASKVLSYQAFGGELSPQHLTSTLRAQVFFPRISNYRNRTMQVYTAGASLCVNQYGILEPKRSGAPLPINTLDVILLPLLGFDRKGNRLGMGGGYYDRALKQLGHQLSQRPLLIGVAHSFQELDSINPDPWDIPMNAILTDQEFIPISSQV